MCTPRNDRVQVQRYWRTSVQVGRVMKEFRGRFGQGARIAEPWRPYRTLACMYLWQIAHTTDRL
jgi:3-methyladenine DNA glycosylase/8-oxoguanine DNA glycosylase